MIASTEVISVSAVIACRNSAGMLQLCLDALSRSAVPVAECIVVDDASSDDSAGVARRFGARIIECEIRQGPARARNIGARHAASDILLFLDADVCLHGDAVSRIASHFENGAADAVIGSYDDSPADQSFLSQYRNLLHCFTHRNGRTRASTFWCGCGAVRRRHFLQLGGFDEKYRRPCIEDIEFGYRLAAAGGRIVLDPSIQAKHLKRWTFGGILRTDIFDRAIPWARLILGRRFMPDDLATRWNQRISVLLALATPFLAAMGYAASALLCIFGIALLNRRFYSFLIAKRGLWFAVRAFPFHYAYHLYSGLAFAIGAATR